MDTPLVWQGLYTLMLAASAALVVWAAFVALRQLYPSLKLFYGQGAEKLSDAVPYGMALAVVVLGFSFAAYVTPATVMAGFAVLVLAGVASFKPLPPMTFQLGCFMASACALFADVALLKEGAFTPQEMGLAAGFIAAPVIASCASQQGEATKAALLLIALIALAAVIAGPMLTENFTHGTAAAAVVCAASGIALVYVQRHHGAVGRACLVALLLVLAHSALMLAHAGQMVAGLALMGALVAAASIAAASQMSA